MKNQKGFTLIELMIVVAIIAVLAGIGLPLYQDNVAKSQVTGALAEITPGKTQVEVLMNEDGFLAANVTTAAAGLGLAAARKNTRCSAIATTATAGAGADDLPTAEIECTINGGSAVNNKTITWKRDGAGAWLCTTTVDTKYIPSTCKP